MTTYREIAETETDPEAALTSDLFKALQKNLLAGLEGDLTAPVNQWDWHPFNKVTVGDANDGRIWGFTANGAVASIITPDFQEGYDYKLSHQFIARTDGGGGLISHNLQFFYENLGNYDTTTRVTPATAGMGIAGGLPWSFGSLILINPRRQDHLIEYAETGTLAGISTGTSQATAVGLFSTTPDRALRARIIPSNGGVISGNANSFFWMYRRRSLSR